jgi:hypothetical protein
MIIFANSPRSERAGRPVAFLASILAWKVAKSILQGIIRWNVSPASNWESKEKLQAYCRCFDLSNNSLNIISRKEGEISALAMFSMLVLGKLIDAVLRISISIQYILFQGDQPSIRVGTLSGSRFQTHDR